MPIALLCQLSSKTLKFKEQKVACATQVIEVLCSDGGCDELWKCDGWIDCQWLTPNDEANCTRCVTDLPNQCKCNVKGNFTCEWDGEGDDRYTCSYDGCK